VWYRHAAALGAVGNVLMMMGANLVGFVIGTEGVGFFVGELFGTVQGQSFLFAPGDIQIGLCRSKVPCDGGSLPFCWCANHVRVSVCDLSIKR